MSYQSLLLNYQQLTFNICTFVFTQPVKPGVKKLKTKASAINFV
jgi:hypothetical protein